jgi:hypothetical protein
MQGLHPSSVRWGWGNYRAFLQASEALYFKQFLMAVVFKFKSWPSVLPAVKARVIWLPPAATCSENNLFSSLFCLSAALLVALPLAPATLPILKGALPVVAGGGALQQLVSQKSAVGDICVMWV